MPHRLRLPLIAFALVASTAAGAQQAAPPPGGQGQTPPIEPHIQPTPLPPAVDIPTVQPPADVPIRPISANEAALIALRHQPNITVAQAGITAAQGRVQAARSGLLPNLGVGAGYTYARSLTGGQAAGTTAGAGGGSVATVSGWQASGNVRQLVFDFNHTLENVREAREAETAASANLTRAQSDTVLQVKQAYYTFVQNNRLVDVNASNVQNQQAHLAEAQARLRAGLGLPSDVVRAQTAVADAIQNLQVARENATNSRVNLALLMGIDPRTPIAATGAAEPAQDHIDFPTLVNQAMTQRPEILEAQANLRSAQHGLSAARTTNAPSLAANLGLLTRGQNFPPNNSSLSIGASIAWDAFDAGLTAGLVKEARAGVTTAQAQLQSSQLTVTSDVSQAYVNLLTADQRVDTANAEVANAQESVRLATGRFRAGLGIFLDVIDAQNALLIAQTNRVNALSAVDQARAALAHAIGAPVPR